VRHEVWAIAFIFLSASLSAMAAEDSPAKSDTVRLTSHEPNLLGFTKDGSGEWLMDVKVSIQFPVPVLDSFINELSNQTSLQFAFTGRFGQYLASDSAPVIGKRFNPEAFIRHHLDQGAKIEFGYAHESNGQQINSLAGYQQAQQSLARPEFADDYISRGWDFLKLTLRSPLYKGFGTNDSVQWWFIRKQFLSHGWFQKTPEEYNTFENNPEGKPRNTVDGVALIGKYIHREQSEWFSDWKLTGVYDTGYHEIFRYNSLRLEGGVKIRGLPVIAWASQGYNSDLARYYKNVYARGFAVEIGAF